LVFVDDDNLPCKEYLGRVKELLDRHPGLGALGGRIHPEFETPPPTWTEEFHSLLALRDLGPDPLFSQGNTRGRLESWPSCAPIGAGMAVRRQALRSWLNQDPLAGPSDRKGMNLSSGGDNDMIAHVLEEGWQVAYFPELSLVHLMPSGRLELAYLGRLNRGIQGSWMQVLSLHGINPWGPISALGTPLRMARAWLRRGAWRGGAAWVRWQGDCGHFEGRARTIREDLRALGLGWLFHHCVRRPLGALRRSFRTGGPLVARRIRQGMTEMAAASATLPLPIGTDQLPPLSPQLLTGARFWDQTAFCLWTLAHQSGRTLAPVIHDDGSLTAMHRESLRRLFPAAEFRSQSDTLARLDALIPETRYPRLRERWRNYPNIRKLIDVHLGSQGWKLVLDSDMLFFGRPDELVTWMDAPARPLLAVDCTESYGYRRSLMEALAGAPIAPRVNVGVCGLNSSSIDWDQVESWIAALEQAQGQNYYLEQALVAMLTAGQPSDILDAGRYVTMPSREECLAPSVVLHHYVDVSKRWYFTRSWRLALRAERSPTR